MPVFVSPLTFFGSGVAPSEKDATVTHTVPPRISIRRLEERLRQSGYGTSIESKPIGRPGTARQYRIDILRKTGTHRYRFSLVTDPLPDGSDPLDYEFDTEKLLPPLRRRLHLTPMDGEPDEKFFRHW